MANGLQHHDSYKRNPRIHQPRPGEQIGHLWSIDFVFVIIFSFFQMEVANIIVPLGSKMFTTEKENQ